jgi:hypothetical protein
VTHANDTITAASRKGLLRLGRVSVSLSAFIRFYEIVKPRCYRIYGKKYKENCLKKTIEIKKTTFNVLDCDESPKQKARSIDIERAVAYN